MKQRQNILLFMTDHQRDDMIGTRHCGREVTPNLNRLAREGVRFERAYDTCPLCVPARTALATGIYPTKNGVVYNDWQGKTAGDWVPIHRKLKEAGYRVGHVGVDHIRVRPPMREQGLDFFVSQEDYEQWAAGQGIATRRESRQLARVREEIEGAYEERQYSNHRAERWDGPEEHLKDHYFKEKALEFIRETGSEPFALFVYLWAPHPPFKVPEPYYSMYDPEQIVLPDNVGTASRREPALRRLGTPAQMAEGVTQEEWRQAWAAHLGLTTMADHYFGEIVDALKEKHVYDNTCVLYTSDHGEHLGQHRMYQKMEMYQEAVHVPFVLKVPGVEPGTVGDVISHLDIYPTFCEAAGISGEDREGLSLLDAARQKHGDENRIVYAQYSGNPGYGTIRRAAVSRRYKYVYDGSREEELYDLERDPGEMNNVAGEPEYDGAVRAMREACKNYHQEQEDFFIWNPEVGQAQRVKP